MKGKFSKTEMRGLPGGPNQQFTYVTGVFMQDMYHVPKAQEGIENNANKYLDKSKQFLTDWYSSDIAKQMLTESYKKQYEGTPLKNYEQAALSNLKQRIDNINSKINLEALPSGHGSRGMIKFTPRNLLEREVEKNVGASTSKNVNNIQTFLRENIYHPLKKYIKNNKGSYTDPNKNLLQKVLQSDVTDNFMDNLWNTQVNLGFFAEDTNNLNDDYNIDLGLLNKLRYNQAKLPYYEMLEKEKTTNRYPGYWNPKEEGRKYVNPEDFHDLFQDPFFKKNRNELSKKYNTIYYNQEKYLDELPNTMLHELGHLSTDGNFLIPNEDIRTIQKELPSNSRTKFKGHLLNKLVRPGYKDAYGKNLFAKEKENQKLLFKSLPYGYYDNPTEVQTRLNIARSKGKEFGWDAMKRKATKKDVEQLKKSKNRNIQELFKNYSPEHILKMLNSVAMEDQGQDMYYGQKGVESKDDYKNYVYPLGDKTYQATPYALPVAEVFGNPINTGRQLLQNIGKSTGYVADQTGQFLATPEALAAYMIDKARGKDTEFMDVLPSLASDVIGRKSKGQPDVITSLTSDDWVMNNPGKALAAGLFVPGFGGKAKNISKINKVVNPLPSVGGGLMNQVKNVHKEILPGLYNRGKKYDKDFNDIDIANIFNNPNKIEYIGTKSGRPIVRVEMPDGYSEYFYKSSGWARKKGEGAGGTTEGLWQPFGGHTESYGAKDWFIKDKGYKDYYGSKTYRTISENLDNVLMKNTGIDNIKDLNKAINFKKVSGDVDTYLPNYKDSYFTAPDLQKGGEGYRINAPDYDDPYKVIPSGNITMTEQDGGPLKKGPLLGIDNMGNQQMMFPGYNYVFPGDMVMEIPVAQSGLNITSSTAKGGKLKGDDIRGKSLNQRLYESITPIGYDWKHALKEFRAGKRLPFKWDGEDTTFEDFDKMDRWRDSETGELSWYGKYVKEASDDHWNYYLNKKQKYDTFYPSKYKPSSNTGEDVEYMQFEYDEDIFDEAGEYGMFDEKVKVGTNKQVTDSAAGGFTLKDYTLSRGRDERGDYISYYDKVDFAPSIMGMKVPVEKFVGKPYDFYGRMYYTKEGDKIKRIFPEAKQKGGGVDEFQRILKKIHHKRLAITYRRRKEFLFRNV